MLLFFSHMICALTLTTEKCLVAKIRSFSGLGKISDRPLKIVAAQQLRGATLHEVWHVRLAQMMRGPDSTAAAMDGQMIAQDLDVHACAVQGHDGLASVGIVARARRANDLQQVASGQINL
jgi:hypothetical protein